MSLAGDPPAVGGVVQVDDVIGVRGNDPSVFRAEVGPGHSEDRATGLGLDDDHAVSGMNVILDKAVSRQGGRTYLHQQSCRAPPAIPAMIGLVCN